MIKIHKKTLVALLLSIAVHVVIIVTLYIYFNKANDYGGTVEYTGESKSTNTEHNQLQTREASYNKSADISTAEIKEDAQKLLSLTEKPEVLTSEIKKASSTVDNVETYTSRKKAIAFDKDLEPTLPDKNLANLNEGLVSDTATNDINLLSTDITNDSGKSGKIGNENLLKMKKAELEDINSQLSAAINEVKNRNQQRIDQLSQEQDYSSKN